MDGSSVIDGVEQTNRLIFVDFLLALSLSNQYQGAEKTAAIFRTGKNYRLNSNVLAFNDKEKDKIYLQQLVGRQERKTISVPDDIPRYSERLEVETTTFYPQDDGAYYYPLSAVTLIDTDAESEAIFQVPAIYVKAISDEAEWQDIALALRIGGNVLAIVLGIATLGAGSPLLIGLAVADITLATTDILVAVSQDPLMQTADGQEFLKTWDKVYLAGGIATAAPLLVGNAFSAGAKLLSKATLATTKNFLRASLLKMAMELNIPNFATGTIKVLDSGSEVYHATYSVIRMGQATRLQQAGVLFVKGEMTGGRAAKNGLVVIYKGEVIASGEAKAVKKSLGDIWKLKGAKLTNALNDILDRIRTPFINGYTKEMVLAIPKGKRPNPNIYLDNEYIYRHSVRFEEGVSFLIKKSTLDKYGREILGRSDNSLFVMTKKDMDDLLLKAKGNYEIIETELGFGKGHLSNEVLVRIDVKIPENIRIPNGNELGANELWIPGGKLPNGYFEAVINNVNQGKYLETTIYTRR